MSGVKMKCLVCKRPLNNAGNGQPNYGTEFVGGGAYGSTVTDIVEHRFAIYVCDDCIKSAGKDGAVLAMTNWIPPSPEPHYRKWSPRE